MESSLRCQKPFENSSITRPTTLVYSHRNAKRFFYHYIGKSYSQVLPSNLYHSVNFSVGLISVGRNCFSSAMVYGAIMIFIVNVQQGQQRANYSSLKTFSRIQCYNDSHKKLILFKRISSCRIVITMLLIKIKNLKLMPHKNVSLKLA